MSPTRSLPQKPPTHVSSTRARRRIKTYTGPTRPCATTPSSTRPRPTLAGRRTRVRSSRPLAPTGCRGPSCRGERVMCARRWRPATTPRPAATATRSSRSPARRACAARVDRERACPRAPISRCRWRGRRVHFWAGRRVHFRQGSRRRAGLRADAAAASIYRMRAHSRARVYAARALATCTVVTAVTSPPLVRTPDPNCTVVTF